MDITTTIGDILERDTDAIVLNLFEGVTEPGGATGAANRALDGLIADLIAGGDFSGKFKETAVLYPHQGVASSRLILVGLGNREDFSLNRVRLVSASAAREAIKRGAKTLASIIHGGGIGGLDISDAAQATVEGAILGNYKFTAYKTAEDDPNRLDAFTLVEFDASKQTAAEAGAIAGQIIAESACFARDLGNTPGNDLPPATLADRALEMARATGLSCEIFDEQRVLDEGMNALSAVGQGSVRPPRFVILEHAGANPEAAPIVFIGKGITFDTGGISLKGGDGMWDMKFDMSGASAVIGAMRAVAKLDLTSASSAWSPLRKTCPTAGPIAPATSCVPWARKPSRFAAQTPKAASSSSTPSHTVRATNPKPLSTSPRSPARASSRSAMKPAA